MTKAKDKLSFEASMKKLEEAATALRSGELSLEESVQIYEEGIKYYQFCREYLEQAKQKIEIYRPETGKTEDFEV